MKAPGPFTAGDGWRYGLLGLPLAFVALPLYVVLPNHYATTYGVPLAALGVLLLCARLADAVADPLIGRFADRLFARSPRAVLACGLAAAAMLAGGFALLFFPPALGPRALLAWAALSLALTYAGYSMLSIAHQSWGAMLGGDELQRSRIVAWREGFGLAGVLLASAAPLLLGLEATAGLLAAFLVAGWLAWTRARRPLAFPVPAGPSVWRPFSRPAFRTLLAAFMLNGVAAAIPATLFLFFVQDRLGLSKGWEAGLLATYFVAGAASIPAWLRMVAWLGLARAWLAGMALAVLAFVSTSALGAGDAIPFLVVCVASGLALGADLALPGALLAGVIAAAGDRGRGEGAYFGWWNFATKFNLALAAGLALPVLAAFGYAPGTRTGEGLAALALAYGALPCALKLAAAAVLWRFIARQEEA